MQTRLRSWKINGLAPLLIGGCLLTATACGSKTAGSRTAPDGAQASSTAPAAMYEGVQPHASRAEVPEDSLKFYDPDQVNKQYVDGAERWFYRDTLMHGAYKSSYFYDHVMYYSVATYRNGVKNDTVRHYHATEKWLAVEVITPDSLHEIYQAYYNNGNPKVRYESAGGRLNGAMRHWFIDGKPEKLEYFKDGRRHGEEKSWYPNGYLASEDRYADDNQVGPYKSWNYSQGKDDAYYYLGATEAPDRQFVAYSLYNGYRIEESYEAAGDGTWLLTKRSLYERDEKLCTFEKHGCDLVKHDTVPDGSRLEVRDYCEGRLQSLEQYPLSSGGAPAVFTETYSDTGRPVTRQFYDDEYNRLEPIRVYAQEGASVTGMSSSEYEELAADSCNVYLAKEESRWVQDAGSATLRCQGKEIELLGSSGSEDASDFYRQWNYDGYNARSGMHFFNFEGFEVWGYFAADDATGRITKYDAVSRPVFCGRSDLFFVENGNPYEGGCAVCIYRQLPGGRLAKVATLDRGGVNFYTLDLENLTWVGERTLVATRIEPGRRNERYYTFDDERANEGELPYLRIEVTPEAWQNAEPLPLSDGMIREMNDQMKVGRDS